MIFAVPFVIALGSDAWNSIFHIMLADYVPFIILLWGLFTISGGIYVGGSMAGTPRVNTALHAAIDPCEKPPSTRPARSRGSQIPRR